MTQSSEVSGDKMTDTEQPHTYEQRVLDSIAHVRAEMAKGFYHPDKEPLEVIMYAAEEALQLRMMAYQLEAIGDECADDLVIYGMPDAIANVSLKLLKLKQFNKLGGEKK